MIHFIARQELFKIKFVRRFLYSTQQSNFQAFLENCTDEAEKLELQRAIAPRFDALNHGKLLSTENSFHEHILQIDAANVNGLIRKLAAEITSLIARLKTPQVFFFTAQKCSWFEQTNSYKSVRRITQDLFQITGDMNYSEAFQVDLNSLERFLKIAFWIGRCNASMPPIYFHPQHEPLIFQICQYGNVHLWSGKMKKRVELNYFLRDTRFCPISHETERFSANGQIAGRKMIV
ncbi:hypothetical protein Ctha_2101 [Chloroherpeton thalassium ATCC 35110]|uniref:Uncharacterized protein n=1 Tax=Chloroherpeton thalassium (strain ATCC 35110 / GB-78) TaxID=517418 RepID=B3QVF3_CHLT3|nr:hypothetical protein [Chloroherpeton thalassium]ACF14553.1 hypothetical protein Ctha_2101 [Chloroherpeton thalassium ATCC 35110]